MTGKPRVVGVCRLPHDHSHRLLDHVTSLVAWDHDPAAAPEPAAVYHLPDTARLRSRSGAAVAGHWFTVAEGCADGQVALRRRHYPNSSRGGSLEEAHRELRDDDAVTCVSRAEFGKLERTVLAAKPFPLEAGYLPTMYIPTNFGATIVRINPYDASNPDSKDAKNWIRLRPYAGANPACAGKACFLAQWEGPVEPGCGCSRRGLRDHQGPPNYTILFGPDGNVLDVLASNMSYGNDEMPLRESHLKRAIGMMNNREQLAQAYGLKWEYLAKQSKIREIGGLSPKGSGTSLGTLIIHAGLIRDRVFANRTGDDPDWVARLARPTLAWPAVPLDWNHKPEPAAGAVPPATLRGLVRDAWVDRVPGDGRR